LRTLFQKLKQVIKIIMKIRVKQKYLIKGNCYLRRDIKKLGKSENKDIKKLENFNKVENFKITNAKKFKY